MKVSKKALLLVVAFFAVNLSVAHGSELLPLRSVSALGLNTSGDTYELQVTPVGNPDGYRAVALNVTVVDGEAAAVGGYVTVFPCGDRPVASNVNFVDGQTVPNAVIAPVSADGRVCFYVYGKAHVVVDVAGYFTSGFSALAKPERFLDTRSSGVKVGEVDGSGGAYALVVGGVSGVPTGVSTVALNVTVVDGEAAAVGGYVTVFPCGDRPVASNVNFVDGQTVPNAVIAPVSADGRVCFYVYGKAHVVVDVAGYFTSGFSALAKPERFLDTRSSGVKVGELTKVPGVLTGGATKAPAGPVALGLNLTGASALVQTSQVSARSVMGNRVPYTASLSNLYKVTASGTVEPVATDQSIYVDDAVVGPNGKLYTIAYGQSCLLAETDVTTNQSVCIENAGGSLTIWQSNETANFPRIQFDNSGGVYYLALTPRSDGRAPFYVYTIRRFKDGVITDMFDLPDQVVRFWHVVPNGSIIFSGQILDYNSAGEQYEVSHETKIVTSDRLMSVISDAQAWFFSDFGTDLVYYGVCGAKINDPSNSECGHRIYDPVAGQVRDTYFLSGSNNTPRASAIYDADEICAAYPAEVVGSFCGNSYGAIAGPFSSTTDGAYFAKIEAVMQPFPPTHLSQVFQYYPEVKPVVSSVLKARIIETEGDDLFLSGVDRSGNFKTIKLNTKSGSESTMLSVADGVDVVELEAVGSENKLYFRGTRVTDNSEVIGFVDLLTNAVTIQNFAQGSVVNIEAVSQ